MLFKFCKDKKAVYPIKKQLFLIIFKKNLCKCQEKTSCSHATDYNYNSQIMCALKCLHNVSQKQ